jgi:hypothetical protein
MPHSTPVCEIRSGKSLIFYLEESGVQGSISPTFYAQLLRM